MNIELNQFGLIVDSDWLYVELDWKLVVILALVSIGYKIYKRKIKYEF